MDEQEIPTPEARERDALFGASARRSAADSPSPMGHDSRTEASLALGGGTGGGWDAPSTATWIGMTRPQQDGQQLGQLSWAEVRKKVDVAERQRGLRSAYESVEVGRETLERLEDQKEKLDRSEVVLDSTKYALERSARVIRGMTFWGKIQNAFSDDTQIPQTYRNYATNTAVSAMAADDDTPVEGFICPDCRRRFDSSDTLVEHFGSAHVERDHESYSGERAVVRAPGAAVEAGVEAMAAYRDVARANNTNRGRGEAKIEQDAASDSLRGQLFGGRSGAVGATASNNYPTEGTGVGRRGIIAEQKAVMDEQNQYLESVGRAVSELGLLGRNIGASLDAQEGTLGRVAEKTEETDDRAAFVTRKAARQAQSSKPKQPTFLKSVALQEVTSGQFLTVIGEDVVLQETELRNVCRFEAWQRQDGIVGLKSGVTRRWLGQTWLGYLRVSGSRFGKTYEWQANLMRRETTMVCCSANWGAGGYLSVRPGATNIDIPASAASDDSRKRDGAPPEPMTASSGGGNSSGSSFTYDRRELMFIDATPPNRLRAAVFRVVNCDGYTPQRFVGGRLMRNPTGR